MASLHQLVAEVSRRRSHIGSVARRIADLRAVPPRDVRHALALEGLIEWGERLLTCHQRDMTAALEQLAELLIGHDLLAATGAASPSGFTLPVVDASRASITAASTAASTDLTARLRK
jgi:hypothetical protein